MKIITDPGVISGYLTDASNTTGHAEALVRPRTTEEVAEVVARCQREGTPLTITAKRTSTTGAPIPQGGWLLSTERLDRILSIDPAGDAAVAEAGVFLGQLQTEIERAGRLFPPDPTSRHECSLGAAIACNASGARSFKYGPTRPWIQALEFVTPTGEIREATRATPIPPGWPAPRWSEPAVKTAAGYYPARNLLDLMIGQEGTLGVITRATLKLAPLPEAVFSVVAFFSSIEDALGFVDAARAGARASAPVSPRLVEWYDVACLEMIRAREPGVPTSAVAAVWCEQEHTERDEEERIEAWLEALEASGAMVEDTLFAQDAPSLERLQRIRHAIPAGINEQIIHNGMPKVGTDCSVPDGALSEMMLAYADVPMPSALFGHVGDNHLHLNMLPRSAAELAQAKEIYRALCRRAAALGGSVSAEHGIGRLKREHLAEMVGPEVLASFRALKRAADPNWILGRGILFSS